MKRRLALRSEHLAELTPNDLASVAAGVTLTGHYPTFDTRCQSQDVCVVVGPILSVNRPCPTVDGCFTGTTLYTVACS